MMFDNFDAVMQGFWFTIKLSICRRAPCSLFWGLVLALLRQLPGRALAPVRWLTIAYIDAFRGIPVLLVILLISGSLGAFAVEGVLPREIGIPQLARQAGQLLVRGLRAHAHLRRLHGRGLPGRASRRSRAARWRRRAHWG